AAYQKAHEAYLADRDELEKSTGEVPEIAGISAGGMPVRVKCLHALVGHSLAAGRWQGSEPDWRFSLGCLYLEPDQMRVCRPRL
ncbi:MAG: hypothetical protein RLZZ576_551, partial [Actinomycetota bacterium]